MNRHYDPRRLHVVSGKPLAPLLSTPMSIATPNLLDPDMGFFYVTVPDDDLWQLNRIHWLFQNLTGIFPPIEVHVQLLPDSPYELAASYASAQDVLLRADTIESVPIYGTGPIQPTSRVTVASRALDSSFVMDSGYWAQNIRIGRIGGGQVLAGSVFKMAFSGWRIKKEYLLG